ncbi:protein SINE1 [Vigna radiata var. radiata]|uniref:Protein SINE1 n=1 Tax=Vigna radiata var. radiata TaxID=3916 RepID=A0A1S3TCC4_VIGRR|nr:protein SINE1 [Vigna radiata var. radiata]XP_014491411.1 protein SINE1 [Vigna radiata var. radiata]XP_022633463.1 protein SINE1 [Vigna radiata var. radiata]
MRMGRSLSPLVRQELANLDKDEESRKSAMKALKSYVKDLDFKAIPVFLAKFSESKESGSEEFSISIYEILVRVHGVKIVPLIDTIMKTIVKTLASSAGSFPLQQACSKVVPAIARYGIDPSTPEDKKRNIIQSLCMPLSDSLASSQEGLTSGAALCLKALVDSENWRYASDELVNRVCQNIAVALEGKSGQTNSHMGLVMSLAKRNALIIEAYARLLIQSGIRIVNVGLVEGNSQKRLSSIQMVNFLMRSLDSRSIFSEVEFIIEELEKCQSDKMAFVQGAALEALQTAKRIASDKRPRYAKSPSSVTGSNFSTREGEHTSSGEGDNTSSTPSSISPESRTLDFFPGYEFTESPISSNLDYERRSVTRKLWSNENGGVDVSLKDGLFSQAGKESALSEHSLIHEFSNGDGYYTEEFAGFMHRNPRHGVSKSTTTSPLRSRTQATIDSIKIFETPRKLIHSLQDSSDLTLDCSKKQNRMFKSLSSGNIEWSPSSKYDQNGFSNDVKCDSEVIESCGEAEFQVSSESVSSSDDLPVDANKQISTKVVPENRNITPTAQRKTKYKLVCGLSFVVLAVATPLLWITIQDEGHYLVPT